jgi:hypothetical protein
MPTWAPEQIEGMRVGGLAQRKRLSRIASEMQLQPEARARKARQELWSANHAQRLVRQTLRDLVPRVGVPGLSTFGGAFVDLLQIL